VTDPLAAAFLAKSRDLLATEYCTKIRLALEPLPDEALWARGADASNAIGNLLLHLAGNVRQWLVHGVGQAPNDARDRNAEFAARGAIPRDTLLAHLDAALDDADAVLARLTAADLASARTIQSRDTTVLAAIYHVVEHFAMHTGQIILLAKLHAPGRIRFYEDEPTGQARPLWKDRT
jgi:uncharacterized damage-inducible protein DinB